MSSRAAAGSAPSSLWASIVLRETEPVLWQRLLTYETNARNRAPQLYIMGKETIDVLVSKWRSRNPEATVEQVLSKSYTKQCGKVS